MRLLSVRVGIIIAILTQLPAVLELPRDRGRTARTTGETGHFPFPPQSGPAEAAGPMKTTVFG